MTMAHESQTSGQEPEVKQAEQQNKFKHDHRKQKGLSSASRSDAADNDENTEISKKEKVHNHKKVHK
jgi:hypothetical protein